MTDNELLLAMSDLLDKKLQPIKDDVQSTKKDIKSTKKDIKSMKQDIKEIKSRLRNVELTQEDMVSQLNEIQSCYTSTFDRYKSGAAQIGAAQADIDVMKSVIQEHSEKLQKLQKLA